MERGMDVTANVFLLAVVHTFMARELAANSRYWRASSVINAVSLAMLARTIGRDLRNSGAVHMEAKGTATALDKGENCILVTPSCPALGLSCRPMKVISPNH
jgi:hypothetical protein